MNIHSTGYKGHLPKSLDQGFKTVIDLIRKYFRIKFIGLAGSSITFGCFAYYFDRRYWTPSFITLEVDFAFTFNFHLKPFR